MPIRLVSVRSLAGSPEALPLRQAALAGSELQCCRKSLLIPGRFGGKFTQESNCCRLDTTAINSLRVDCLLATIHEFPV